MSSATGAPVGRPGVTLPELILVAWLFALVLLATARFAGAQGRLAAVGHDRTRAADVVRTTDLVLNGDLRYTAGPDVTPGPDSVRLRAIRGGGTICSGGDELRVRYRGVRRPDPEKDSVLVVTGRRTVGSAHAVTAVAADSVCAGYRLRLDPRSAAPSGFVLVFETGAYHLADGALRYRRGRGGRQPVTETVLSDGWLEVGPDRLLARLRLHADTLHRLSRLEASAVVWLLNPQDRP